MCGPDPVPVPGGVGVGLLALNRGCLGIGVEPDGHRRFRELHRRNVHQVAPKYELLAVALDDVDAVAGRVAPAGHRLHAGDKLGVTIEGPELSRGAPRRRFSIRVERKVVSFLGQVS